MFALLSNVLIGGQISPSYVSYCVLEIEDKLISPDIRAFRSTEHKESIMDNLTIDFEKFWRLRRSCLSKSKLIL